jgi:hypothetical protein
MLVSLSKTQTGRPAIDEIVNTFASIKKHLYLFKIT